MSVRSYRDLESWQRGMNLVAPVYELTRSFPATERYGLSAQLQRAAVSVPCNIAEGHARDSTREYLRFVSIALGSLAELETQLLLSVRLHLASEVDTSKGFELVDRVGMMLRRLQQSLRQRVRSQPRVPSPEARDTDHCNH